MAKSTTVDGPGNGRGRVGGVVDSREGEKGRGRRVGRVIGEMIWRCRTIRELRAVTARRAVEDVGAYSVTGFGALGEARMEMG